MSLRKLKPVHIGAVSLLLIAVAVCVVVTRIDETLPAKKPRPEVTLEDFSQARAGGCGDIFIYKKAGVKVLCVQLSYTENLDKSVGSFLRQARQKKIIETQFDLSSPAKGLLVEVQMWDRGPGFCDCTTPPANVTATWIAKSGKLTMTAHGPAENLNSDCYRVSALLENVVFEDEKGRQIRLSKETISEVGVGWYAG